MPIPIPIPLLFLPSETILLRNGLTRSGRQSLMRRKSRDGDWWQIRRANVSDLGKALTEPPVPEEDSDPIDPKGSVDGPADATDSSLRRPKNCEDVG